MVSRFAISQRNYVQTEDNLECECLEQGEERMQIKMTNWMQNRNPSNGKITGVQISGLNNNKTGGARKKFAGNSASDAASLDLSKSGRYKARMLKESEKSSSADEVMQKAESTIDDIIDTVRNGGKLTEDQERIFNEGIKDLASKHQQDMKDMKLSPGDVLQELKDNFLQRQQLFADLQEKVESEMSEQQDLTDNVKLMTSQQEQDEKKKLIEILKKTLEDDSEETDNESDSDQKVDDDSPQTSFDVATDDSKQADDSDTVEDAALHDKLKAADMIDKNSRKISDMKDQSVSERKQELLYAKYLNQDYEKIMEALDQDEASPEEKLQAYDDYKQNSQVNAYNREVHRIKKEFDLETWLMAKIQFQSHGEIHNVVTDGTDLSQIGTDFIKKFLV